MNITPTSSAFSLITGAQNKASEAAGKIATLPLQNNEVGSPDFKSADLIKPVLSLNQAELETSAAVKILQSEQKTIGSLLDIRT
ncbi:MAG: hypothetical protein CVV13_09950 [Gammaproteobacteria bacterium HGW-Gammaproteobacteria-3]|nr:MAG: hypothetical protein CVV13_09950 [Gammaproteobacteria bacterium HGW-Gammaproteobacteria-3]